MGNDFSFWIGNQGLEFTSMGRVWQILLFVGLLFWVTLLGRGLMPALKTPSESRGLIAMVFLAALVHRRLLRHLAHLGQTHALRDDRVLALVAGAPVGGRLLRSVRHRRDRPAVHPPGPDPRQPPPTAPSCWKPSCSCSAASSARCTTCTSPARPPSVIAIGAMFSALEVVPLAMIGVEAYRNYQRSQGCALGAGLQVVDSVLHRGGLLERGRRRPARLLDQHADRPVLHARPEHDRRPRPCRAVWRLRHAGHRLLLFCLRGLSKRLAWSDRLLAPMFWSLNIGLAMMVFMSLVPAGIYQAWASVTKGMWFARSPEVMHSPFMETWCGCACRATSCLPWASVLLGLVCAPPAHRRKNASNRPITPLGYSIRLDV
jgi:nitric oxide reductase subunit B